jgi:hypothetical protein
MIKSVACLVLLFVVATHATTAEFQRIRSRSKAKVDMSALDSCHTGIKRNKTFSGLGGCEWILKRDHCVNSGMYWFSHVNRNVYARCGWENGCVATEDACFIEFWSNKENNVGVHKTHHLQNQVTTAENKISSLGKRVASDSSLIATSIKAEAKKVLNHRQAKEEALKRRQQKERKAERVAARAAAKKEEEQKAALLEKKATQAVQTDNIRAKAEALRQKNLETEVIASEEGKSIVGNDRLAALQAEVQEATQTSDEGSSLLSTSTNATAAAAAAAPAAAEAPEGELTEEDYQEQLRTKLGDLNAHHDAHTSLNYLKNLKIQGTILEHQQNSIQKGIETIDGLHNVASQQLGSFIDDQVSGAVAAWQGQ